MDNTLRNTISALETGLRVSQIATFKLKTCFLDQEANQVLADPLLEDFDQIPVRRKANIVGVLERCTIPLGTVRESMLPLDDSLLVAADQPITKFVASLNKRPYRLVLVGTEITGIVTRSDIAKAPVRLLAFTLVSHLEMAMTAAIHKGFPSNDSWLELLDRDRQKKLLGRMKRRQAQNLVLPMIDLADLGDKRRVLVRICGLDSLAERELTEIEDLRNAVAHSRDYARTDSELGKFIDRLSTTRNWIKRAQDLAVHIQSVS
jgi:CBS domain-containing protein